ncbi:MAG: ATP-dependent DNA helicase, partial [Cytophagales bacterium]
MPKNLKEVFEKEIFSKLNSQQKEAVMQIDGPVLVNAGPGTGKTQILSSRIAYILLNTDTAPSSILCLTFTDAGCKAMRQRLLQMIGTDAHKIHIFTFHGFCNFVIQENAYRFGKSAYMPLSELEAIEVMEEMLDDLPVDHVFKRFSGDIYLPKNQLFTLFNNIKKENWKVDELLAMADQHIAGLEFNEKYIYKTNGKTYKKGDLKTAEIKEETQRMERFKAGVKLFDDYSERLKKRMRYDVNDMIPWVLKAFEEDENLLLRYQEQYLYVLVDEFQDTNGSQSDLINQLMSYWIEESPNVFAVGDKNQAIYRFQGAEETNLDRFVERYSPKLIDLIENYRSTQAILDASRSCIINNYHPGAEPPLLVSSNQALASIQEPVEIIAFQNDFQQYTYLVAEIEKMFNDGEDLSEVAIIFRNHKDAEPLVKAFQHRNIPFVASKKEDLFAQPLIQHLVSTLNYLHSDLVDIDSAEDQLFELLHLPYFSINRRDIAKLIRFKHQNKGIKLSELICSSEWMFQAGIIDMQPILMLGNSLMDLKKDYHSLIFEELIEKILVKLGIYRHVFSNKVTEERFWQLELLKSFFDFVRDMNLRKPSFGIPQLKETLRRMESNDIVQPVTRYFMHENGVQLLTAHGSKGLEFEKVYLINAVSENWEKKRENNSNRFALPDGLVKDNKNHKENDERKLFYVACTRAKKKLNVFYFENTQSNGKTVVKNPSIFLEEMKSVADSTKLISKTFVVKDVAHYNHEVEQLLVETLTIPQLSENEFLEKYMIKKSLESFKLSASSLNSYLDCPLKFYFTYVLRVPQAQNDSLGFGSAIHYALENYFKDMLNDGKDFPPKTRLIQLFEEGMVKEYGKFTREEFLMRKEQGLMVLDGYYETHIHEWKAYPIVAIESNLNVNSDHGVPLNGKIDKVVFPKKSKECIVYDYKTGKPENAEKKLNPPS